MPGFSTIKHSYVWHEFVVRFLSVMWKISENNDQIQCQKHEASSKKFYFLQILNVFSANYALVILRTIFNGIKKEKPRISIVQAIYFSFWFCFRF